ncbi:hypothetical protein AAF712_007025 [Marasmius tenuissimus]|uniref:Uncharacterized protein n=1 Tax=Marasmius tenuissimus TaxID=585030 RepID=A0ABR2ZXV2_9AGAR
MFKGLKRAFSSWLSSSNETTEAENSSTRLRPSGKPIVVAPTNIPTGRAESISSKTSVSSIILLVVENVAKRFRRRLPSSDHITMTGDRNPTMAGNSTNDAGIHQDNWDPYAYFPNSQGKVYHVWDNEDGKKYKEDRYTLTWFELNQKKQEEKSQNDAENQRRTRPRATPRYKSKFPYMINRMTSVESSASMTIDKHQI